MAIVTESIRATNTKYINVTYDNAILIPSFNTLQGHMILEFVDGVTVDDNTGIKFYRDDRTGFYELTELNGNQFIHDLESADVGYSKFRFNLSIASTKDVTIDTSNANLYGVDDTDPEPEIITVELFDKFNTNRNYDILFNGLIWGIDELYDDSTGDYADGYIVQSITKGDMVNIEIQSHDGFLFDGYNALYDSHYNMYDFEGSDTFQSVEFEPVESGKIELEISVIEDSTEPDPDPDPEPEPEPDFNFNKIYQVKNEVLNYLAKITPMSDDNNPFTDYIINLIEIPFEIPEKHLTDVDSIIIGFSEFDQPAKKVDRDLIKFDVGKITVPEKYGNSYDYVDTECILHLPYHSNITLDSSYVIDSTIKLEYYLNVYTGDGTVNIYSSKIDDIIHSEKFKLGRLIPFVAKSNMTNDKPDVDFQLFNGLQRAYLEINRNIPIDDLNVNRVSVWGRVGDSDGYVEIDDVQLNFKSSSMDKTEIKSLLRDGVYIK